MLTRVKEQFDKEGPHSLELSLEIESIVFSYGSQKWGEFVDRSFQEYSGTLLAAFGRYRLRSGSTTKPTSSYHLVLPKGHRAFVECPVDVLDVISPEIFNSELIRSLGADITEPSRNLVLKHLFRTKDGQAYVNPKLRPGNVIFYDAWTRKKIADEDLEYLLSANRKPMRMLKNHVHLKHEPSKRSSDFKKAFGSGHFFIDAEVGYLDVMPLCHNHVRVGLATTDKGLQQLIQKYNTHYCEVIEADFTGANPAAQQAVKSLKGIYENRCRVKSKSEQEGKQPSEEEANESKPLVCIRGDEEIQTLLGQLCRIECRVDPANLAEDAVLRPALELSRLRLIEPSTVPEETKPSSDAGVQTEELILLLDFKVGSGSDLIDLQDQQVQFKFNYEGPIAKSRKTFPFVTLCKTAGLDFKFSWDEECGLTPPSAIPVIIGYEGLSLDQIGDRLISYQCKAQDQNGDDIVHDGETRLQVSWDIAEPKQEKEAE